MSEDIFWGPLHLFVSHFEGQIIALLSSFHEEHAFHLFCDKSFSLTQWTGLTNAENSGVLEIFSLDYHRPLLIFIHSFVHLHIHSFDLVNII